VARPTSSTTGSTSKAKMWKLGPKAVACATSARATTAADSTVMYIAARLKTSFQVMLRVASRLQCSVARIWVRTASVTPLRSDSGWRVVLFVAGRASLMVMIPFFASCVRRGGEMMAGLRRATLARTSFAPAPAGGDEHVVPQVYSEEVYSEDSQRPARGSVS